MVAKLLRRLRRGIAGGWVQSPSRTLVREVLGSFGAGGTGRGLVDRIYQPFWRAAPLLLRLTGAAQTGVFSTVWKLFPSLTPSCLSPLVAHHAVPMQRDGMGGGHPLRLCHFQ